MSTNGETADLMVREGIQITESALKLAGLGAKNLAALLIALANDNQKLAGKTNLKRLIHDGEELTIFSVKQEDLKGFQMEAKRYSKKFREEHEEEILLHQAAKNAFDEMGVKKLPKVKELQTEYAKLLEEKKKTYAEYRRSREEMRELLTAKANVDRVLKMEVEQDVEKEKDHGQR